MVPVLDNVSLCLRRRIRYGANSDLASLATDTVSTPKLQFFYLLSRLSANMVSSSAEE
jgi:hypothetical protein